MHLQCTICKDSLPSRIALGVLYITLILALIVPDFFFDLAQNLDVNNFRLFM